METATANAIVTAATGLTAPTPTAAPVIPASLTAPENSGAGTGTPSGAPAKTDLGASPKPGGKSRDDVIRALADGKTEEQAAHPNLDNSAAVKIVDVNAPEVAGAETPTVEAQVAAAAIEGELGADANAVDATNTPVPTQDELEAGLDIGTGDTLFRIRDKDTGQWKATPTDMIEVAMRDPESGEVRTYEKSIPDLVRMARDAVGTQKTIKKIVPEVTYYRENVEKWAQNARTLQQKLDAQMQLNREMLSSEEKYLERREQYAQETTPDKRAERLQAQLNAIEGAQRAQAAKAELAQKVNGFYQTRIQPVVNEALKALPPEMVIGRINADTMNLTVNGVVPPQHWQQFEAYVRGPFAQWAKAEAVKWSNRTQAAQTATAQISAAQKAAQAAKQEQARKMQPVGKVAPATGAVEPPPKLAPPKNKREALDRLVSRPFEG